MYIPTRRDTIIRILRPEERDQLQEIVDMIQRADSLPVSYQTQYYLSENVRFLLADAGYVVYLLDKPSYSLHVPYEVR